MDKNIAKSPEMLVREEKIKALKSQLKKRKTTLKSLKTRLANTKKNIEDKQREVQSVMFSKMMEADSLRREIAVLAEQMKTNKNFSKADRKALDEIARDFLAENIFGDDFQEFSKRQAQMEDGEFDFEFGEEERAKIRDAFQEFQVAPSETEQRSIRKIYLNLSKKFHPDLAESDKEASQFHELMQQINEAYQANDIQTLLEIEQLYLVEDLDYTSKAVTVDMLQQEIDRLERDVEFINSQVERTSGELKNLRDSEMGQMLTNLDRAEKEGAGIKAMGADIQEMINVLKQLKEGLKDSQERGSISPILLQMMQKEEAPRGSEEMLMRLINGKMDMDDLSDMMGDFFYMDDDDDYEEEEEVEDPRFPIGSAVSVRKSIKNPYDKSLNMKGWQGIVQRAYYDDRDRVCYEIDFDSKTIEENVTKKWLKEAILEEDEIFDRHDFKAGQLEAAEIRDTEKERIAAYRTRYIQTFWNRERLSGGEEMIEILLAEPSKTDWENWENYLNKKLPFPFEAKSQGLLGFRKGTKVTVLGLSDSLDEAGFVVKIRKGKGKHTEYYPLIDLRATKETKANSIIELYAKWQATMEDGMPSNSFENLFF